MSIRFCIEWRFKFRAIWRSETAKSRLFRVRTFSEIIFGIYCDFRESREKRCKDWIEIWKWFFPRKFRVTSSYIYVRKFGKKFISSPVNKLNFTEITESFVNWVERRIEDYWIEKIKTCFIEWLKTGAFFFFIVNGSWNLWNYFEIFQWGTVGCLFKNNFTTRDI